MVQAHLERKDGCYHVLLPNGFASVKPGEANENSTTSDAASQEHAAVQGRWVRIVETDGSVMMNGFRQSRGNE